MERIYALGVSCIELVQYWFKDYEPFFGRVNVMSNPHNVLEYFFPMVSILDSVFAAQLCLCCAFGGWLNAVLKWWLLEDRPYWWVRETDFYADSFRPVLRQTYQSCESGPGSPSGHSSTAAMIIMLCVLWASHVFHDKRVVLWWWDYVAWALGGSALLAVMTARVYVATHFPHQAVLGSLLGAFLAPALCIYVVDPHVWARGKDRTIAQLWYLSSAGLAVGIALLTYAVLLLYGCDPLWTVKLAFRWCEQPGNIHPSTTPMFALAQSTGYLLGWALVVTPAVARYRHYTQDRSLIISAIITALQVYLWQLLEQNISKDVAWKFYMTHFFLCAVKPALLLRVTPAIAMWPFKRAFLAPALCIYVVDPHVWARGKDRTIAQLWYLSSAGLAVGIALLTYAVLLLYGCDPLWTVKLAFRWCEQPGNIHPSTTPMFALAQSTGYLLGWALVVTPAVARYRHYTQDRSLIISAIITALQVYMWQLLEQNISKDVAWKFYMTHFFLCAVKPALLLRVTPAIAMWPFKSTGDVKLKLN